MRDERIRWDWKSLGHVMEPKPPSQVSCFHCFHNCQTKVPKACKAHLTSGSQDLPNCHKTHIRHPLISGLSSCIRVNLCAVHVALLETGTAQVLVWWGAQLPAHIREKIARRKTCPHLSKLMQFKSCYKNVHFEKHTYIILHISAYGFSINMRNAGHLLAQQNNN